MRPLFKILIFKFLLISNFFVFSYTNADNHNIYETLEQIQKDLKTLEKAVYSGSISFNENNNNFIF